MKFNFKLIIYEKKIKYIDDKTDKINKKYNLFEIKFYRYIIILIPINKNNSYIF